MVTVSRVSRNNILSPLSINRGPYFFWDTLYVLPFFLGFKSTSCRKERKELHNTESPYSLFSHGTWTPGMWICVLSSVSGIYLTTNHLLPRIPWFLLPVTWHRENNYQSLQRTYLSITGCHHSFLGKPEVFNIQILIRLSFSKSKWMLENEMPIFSVYVMEIFCELKLDHNRQNTSMLRNVSSEHVIFLLNPSLLYLCSTISEKF